MGTATGIYKAFKGIPRNALVLQYPNDNATFSKLLDISFREAEFNSRRFPAMTSHKGINLLLLPIWSVFFRFRGTRIINIHWITGQWQTPKMRTTFCRFILWNFFKTWLMTLRLVGIKVVYTVHDHEPHSKIFNDDKKGVKYLIKRSDAVIFLNPSSAKYFETISKDKISSIIPEGLIRHDTSKTRTEMRKELRVPDNNILIILIGSLEEYKGVDLILEGIKELPANVSIRIAGTSPHWYRQKLSKIFENIEIANLDIEIEYRFLSDEDFGNYLLTADYFLYPCREINNSGSLNAALSHGLPVIVPKMDGLDWVPQKCKILIEGSEPNEYNIGKAISSLNDVSCEDYQRLSIAALDFSSDRDWTTVALSYMTVYKQLL